MESTSTSPPSRTSLVELTLNLVVISLLTILALRSLVPPVALPATAALSVFSADRAADHLKAIAREPHPTGSTENVRVRNYIVEQLKSLGLEPQVQKAVSSTTWDIGGAPYGSGTVQNVMARLQGTNNRGTLLLVAHYDSVATGPGAADNGSGVVTLLETLRALGSGAPLGNDVVAVFTDGEEDGGLGAQAFVDEHPWARDASLALVVDSGGSCGPAAITVNSEHNGWLVRGFAKALGQPLAASISDELRALAGGVANGDHSPLYQKGIRVLSLGFDGCQATYHTMLDAPGYLDARSLQDLGNYLLRLSRHFGNLDLQHAPQDDVIYFPLFGYLIFYPELWALAPVVLSWLILLATVFLGFKRRQLAGRGLALGLLLWAGAVVIAIGTVAFFWWALQSLHLVNKSFVSAYEAETYALGFVALAAAGSSALYVAFRRKVNSQSLAMGGFLLCAALMTVAYVVAPKVSYLVVWPLLFVLLSMGFGFALNRPDSLSLKVAQLLCAVPTVALFAPLIGYFAISPGEDLKQATTIVGIITVIVLGLLSTQLEAITGFRKWLFPAMCAVLGAGFISFGAMKGGYDATHPKPDSISYWFDADAGKASWISFDEKPDSWTSQFLSGQVETDKVGIFGSADGDVVLKGSAPRVELQTPIAKIVQDSTAGGERTLRFHITSLRQARILWVIVRKVVVIRATLDGRHVQVGEGDARDKLWGVVYVGVPSEGIDLELTVKSLDNPQLTITDQSDGLPDIPGFSMRLRPNDRMPSPQVWPFFDSTVLVSRSFPAGAHDH
jgi:hypothetical protein